MTNRSYEEMRSEIILLNKNGINFILAASICWVIISLIWMSHMNSGKLVLYSFLATMPMLPLVFVFGKIFKTS